MSIQRCPNCNKILSPRESRCSNCGAKLDNKNIVQINDIYHSSNATLYFFLQYYLLVHYFMDLLIGWLQLQ